MGENIKTIKEVFSEQETFDFAYGLAKAAQGGIYCLCGDLGVGKTVFAKGFAKGLGIDEHITSPTFTIVNEYKGKLPFYHFDVYRISDIEEMYEIGFDEYIFGDGICLIEWADIIKELLPENAIWITIEKDMEKTSDYRKIEIVYPK